MLCIDWDEFISKCSVEEFPILFNQLIFTVLQKHCPVVNKQRKQFKSSYRKKREVISRKIRKFRKQILKSSDLSKIAKLNDKIEDLLAKQKESFFQEKYNEENIAISKIKSDSKYFFKYVKRFRKILSHPSVLVDPNGKLLTHPKAVADCLQDHFLNVFSDPQNKNINPPNVETPENLTPISDFYLTTTDIEKAIGELKTQSSCPRSEIPAIVFKQCKSTISYPLKLFWSKSFHLGIVPKIYKLQQIIPIHKKGSKTDPKNFRPICLTSHVIKIFERVLRDKLVNFFESNNIINKNQHGFRKKRSCLSQLLFYTNFVL